MVAILPGNGDTGAALVRSNKINKIAFTGSTAVGRDIQTALAAGNVAVAILSESRPLVGLDLAEVLGVSDVPGGVVNLLSGRRGELASALGAHRDLNAIVDAAGDPDVSAELDRLGAETIKRVRHGPATPSYDAAVGDALERLAAVTELKTAWHPVGA